MVTSRRAGLGNQDEDYVQPLEPEAIDPLTVDPVGAATSAIDIVPQPVSAVSGDSPYTALLKSDEVKVATGPIRKTTGIAIPTPDRTDELDENADIDSEDRVDSDDAIETEPEARVRAATAGYRPEQPEALTADRLLQPTKQPKELPTGLINELVYAATFHLVNLGDSPKMAAYKAQSAAIARRLQGEMRYIPVLTRKGGVGKTTVTALVGMALADSRDDRVIAIDANPDRGTLAERFDRQTEATVRSVVRDGPKIQGYTGFTRYITRDETRLDVLASDADPNVSEAFSDKDYDKVAAVAAQYYSIALTDCGTGIVHSVMKSVLAKANSVIVVTGASLDEVRLASETLTWLEHNGHSDLVTNAVVAINLATQGAHLVNMGEIEAHFGSRVRSVVRVPYDPQLAAGSVIHWNKLAPRTRQAARDLAEAVVAGLED